MVSRFFDTKLFYRNRFTIPLLAFFIPLAVRVIPEILMGPYIVGFDTLGFYVPNTIIWHQGGLDLWSFLSIAPLFYSLLTPIITGAPIALALKVLSPVLLGLLGLSIYIYARRGLSWSPLKSLAPALLGTLYFVALRLSWDMLRNELGLIFLFIALTLLIASKAGLLRTYGLLSFAIMAVVLSHQLVSVIMLGIIAFTVIQHLIRREYTNSVRLFVSALPALAFFLLFYFGTVAPYGFQDYQGSSGSSLATWLGFSSYSAMLISEAGFFLYCFLPLLPLAVIAVRRLGVFQLRVWVLLTLMLCLIPFAFVSPFRWLIMLLYPLSFLCVEALSLLKGKRLWKKNHGFSLRRLALLYLVVSTVILSTGYIFMPPEQPFYYFNSEHVNSFVYQIPSSMLQNTVSISDCNDVARSLEWYVNNANSSSVLLTHRVFYGWALLKLTTDQVRTYEFDDPTASAAELSEDGHSIVYVIWWVNGQGWYDQLRLPSSFEEVFQSGHMAIYRYNVSSLNV